MSIAKHKELVALQLLILSGITTTTFAQSQPDSKPVPGNHLAIAPIFLIALIALSVAAIAAAVRLYFRNRQLEKDYAIALKTKENYYVQTLAIGALSHDLRTPLTLILGNLELIKTELDKFKGSFSDPNIAHLPGFFNSKLTIIRQNAEGLSSYVARLLNTNNPTYETLNRDENTMQSDVLAFVRYGMSIVETIVDKQNVELKVETPLESLVMDFNLDQLGNMLLNLFTNALKFTPKGGKVTFGIDADGPGRRLGEPLPPGFEPTHAIFTITDTGVGIPKKNLKKIFERGFFTKPVNELNISDEDKGSSGIGLFAVKGQVELLKGEITVNSTEGKGSTFTIRIPITRNAPLRDWVLGEVDSTSEALTEEPNVLILEDAPTKLEVLVEDANLPRLLLIEDNEGIVDYIKSSFKGIYQVDFAYDGLAGIGKALEQVPDIIITDLMMPEKNGYEVCETLKKDGRTSHIPIVMLTALTDLNSRVTGINKGADAYIGKPAYRAELHAILDGLLENRKKLQAKYLAAATQAVVTAEKEMGNDVPPLENEFLKKLRLIIEEDLADTALDVERICRKIGMSRSSLHAKLSALTGTSVTHFVRAIRLSHAKELLSNTDMNISEIAGSVGFDNPNYFSRLFSEEFGMPPSSFRKGG